MVRGALAGDSDGATTTSANAFVRYYMLQAPIKEALLRYVDYAADTAEQAKAAAQWYDGTYRAQMLPPLRFFLAQLKPRLGVPPRRFVQVAREFLVTPHAELQRRYMGGVPLAAAHHQGLSKEALLGIVGI